MLKSWYRKEEINGKKWIKDIFVCIIPINKPFFYPKKTEQ